MNNSQDRRTRRVKVQSATGYAIIPTIRGANNDSLMKIHTNYSRYVFPVDRLNGKLNYMDSLRFSVKRADRKSGPGIKRCAQRNAFNDDYKIFLVKHYPRGRSLEHRYLSFRVLSACSNFEKKKKKKKIPSNFSVYVASG